MIAKAKTELIGCEMGREMDEVAGLKIENAGRKVNTKYSEYSPYLTSPTEMYFTAIQADDVIVVEEAKDDFHSKAFTAKHDGKKWGKPSALGTNINREGYHIGNLSITKDGSRKMMKHHFIRKVPCTLALKGILDLEVLISFHQSGMDLTGEHQ